MKLAIKFDYYDNFDNVIINGHSNMKNLFYNFVIIFF